MGRRALVSQRHNVFKTSSVATSRMEGSNQLPVAAASFSSSSSLSMSEKEAPFGTWTYDKHCEEMSWTESKDASVLSVSSDASAADDCDL
eukprot:6111067-Ditylum_brightwellii.AAC.1